MRAAHRDAGSRRAARPVLRAAAHGFTWLRDLRALGTDRGAAAGPRAGVGLDRNGAPHDAVAQRPDVAGARIAAWLGHYDFFFAAADDAFRQRLMARLVSDARALSAALPAEELDARALTALKGLIAAAVALPDHAGFLTRALRFLPQEIARQVLPDGCHAERSPAAQLAALQDLTEIRALLQAAQAQPPPALAGAIERMAPALRAPAARRRRLWRCSTAARRNAGTLIELVLTQAGRGGRGAVVAARRRVPAPAGRAQRADGGLRRATARRGSTATRMPARCRWSCRRPRPADRELRRVSGGPGRVARRVACHRGAFDAGDRRCQFSRELKPDGLGRRPETVEVQRQEANGAHWLEASHDGWTKPFGAVHRRRLYMAESGEDIRGEDVGRGTDAAALHRCASICILTSMPACSRTARRCCCGCPTAVAGGCAPTARG